MDRKIASLLIASGLLPCLHSLPQYLSVKNQVYQFAALEVGQRVFPGAHTVPILPLPCPLDCWESMILV